MRTTLLLLAGSLLMQQSKATEEHPINFRISAAESESVRPGGTLWIAIGTMVPPGWHLYGIGQPPGGPIATSFSVDPAKVFRLGKEIDGPVARLVPEPIIGVVSQWHEDSVVFRLPVLVSRDSRGRQKLKAMVTYQTCNDIYCLPQTTDTLALTVSIEGDPVVPAVDSSAFDAAAAPAITAPTPAPTTSATAALPPPVTQYGAGSSLPFIVLAATMGLLALLTPCVFPMVPITISHFSHNKSRRSSTIAEAALFATGIVATFTLVGLALSFAFGAAGVNRLAANPWLNLGIAALFTLFALNLFGVFEIPMPARLAGVLDKAARGGKVGRNITTIAIAATFAVTTFTCTAPFVGGLLATAATGDWRWPALGLFVFSSAFALPFFVLALLPKLVTRLPRGGEWLVTTKRSLAFVEVAAALKFVSNADLVQGWGVFTRDVVIAGWLLCGLMLALHLAGVRLQSKRLRPSESRYPYAAVVVLLAVIWLGTGLRGNRLGELESFLPPAGQMSSGATDNELHWITDDLAGALTRAATEKKHVLIDFTGYTCTNCRWMEANMFTRMDVERELEKFVRVRLFTDGSGEIHRQQQRLELEKFGTVALPLYAIVDSLGNPRASFLGMTRDEDRFAGFLRNAHNQR